MTHIPRRRASVPIRSIISRHRQLEHVPENVIPNRFDYSTADITHAARLSEVSECTQEKDADEACGGDRKHAWIHV
jgi:hypothetical protein